MSVDLNLPMQLVTITILVQSFAPVRVMPRYSWNIAKDGVKHQSFNQSSTCTI